MNVWAVMNYAKFLFGCFDHCGRGYVQCFCFCADGQSVAAGRCRTSETPTCSSSPNVLRQPGPPRDAARQGAPILPPRLPSSRSASTRETATGPVQGYLATQSGTGTKTDTPLSQTAQSISVVSAERVRDQGVSSVQETLRYVPGVFAEPGGVDSRNDYFKIRGQDPNVYLDGTRVNNRNNFNEWRVDPYMLERIEVFRGPASVLYGDTSTAGLVNLISKRPRAETYNEVGVSFDNFGRKQVQMDSTGKVTKDGECLYRFVGLFRDSGTQVDFVPDNRILLAPSMTWRPTTNTSWTVLGVYQKDQTGTTNGFLPREGTLLPSINGYIPRERFVGDPTTDLYQTETGAISSLFEHTFNDAVKFTQNLRYAHVDGVYRSVYANVFMADPFFPYPARRTVSRFGSNQAVSNDNFTIDNNIQVKALTGALEHKVLFGVDYRNFFARSSVAPFSADTTPFDLYAPVYTSVPLPDLTRLTNAQQNQAGLYAQDQMRLGPWLATIGVRQDYAATRYPGSDSDRSATTGRASLMYETPFGFNPYVVWAQSFNPVYFSPTFGGSNCLSGPCKDQRGEIYEVGFKYTPMQGLAINGAIYDTVEKNRLSASTEPANPVEPDRTSPYPRRGNRGHRQGHARSRRDRQLFLHQRQGRTRRQYRQERRGRARQPGFAVGQVSPGRTRPARRHGRRRRALHRRVHRRDQHLHHSGLYAVRHDGGLRSRSVQTAAQRQQHRRRTLRGGVLRAGRLLLRARAYGLGNRNLPILDHWLRYDSRWSCAG